MDFLTLGWIQFHPILTGGHERRLRIPTGKDDFARFDRDAPGKGSEVVSCVLKCCP
jgi:hypothetical protein